MDVAGWTMERRLMLPDYCFGNRRIVGCHQRGANDGVHLWARSETTLPDPACIWQLVITSMPQGGGTGWVRLGLADAIPTTVALMDAAVELFPDYGRPQTGPNEIILRGAVYAMTTIQHRKGLVTGGKYLVMELYTILKHMNVDAGIVVSGLPTEVSGYFNYTIP